MMKATISESKTGILWLFSLMIVIGLFLLTTKPVYAVVGNVSLVSAGEPVGQATISFQTADGQVVAEGKTDDDGKAAILIPDSYKGQALTVVARDGNRTIRQSVNVDRDDLKIALFLPKKAGAHKGFRTSLGFSPFYKWANFHGAHTYNGQTVSGDLDSSSPGVGVGFQIRPPSTYFGGLPLFLALSCGFPSNIDDSGVRADYHPAAGIIDTYLSIAEHWYSRVMLGYEILALQQLQCSLFGGVQFTEVKVKLTADESGGGGVVNKFNDTEIMKSPALGLGFSYPLFNNVKAYLVGSFFMAWMDDIRGNSKSSLGLDYIYKIKGGLQPVVQLGIRIPIF